MSSHIYIANATKQNHEFIARIPERPNPMRMPIAVGRQIRFPGNSQGLPKKILDDIIKHHERYGLTHVSKIEDIRKYSGLIWSEKPIESGNIMRAVTINDDLLEERGQRAREEAAIVAAGGAMNQARDAGANVLGSDLNAGFEIRQDRTKENPNPQVSQTFNVTSDADKLQEAENMGHEIITPRPDGSQERVRGKRRSR